MRILLQPTGPATDWEEHDSSEWASLSTFTPMAINCCGMVMAGPDHYSIEEPEPDVVNLIGWHDDPAQWPVGQRWANVVTIRTLAPDSALNGAINTRIAHTIYAEAGAAKVFINPRFRLLPWEDFDPRRVNPMHGVFVSDAEYLAHQKAQSIRGWREWTDDLDPSEIDDVGKVRQQRHRGRYFKPRGTRTYFLSNTAGPDIHSATNPDSLLLSTGSAAFQSCAPNQNGLVCYSGVTPTNEPDSSAWPTTGVYRQQIDCTTLGTPLDFGCLTLNGNVGHFARVNSGATADQESFEQDQAAFTATGLSIASVTNPAWSSGAASDRFETVIAANRPTGHGTLTMTLELNESDDFADGPWAAAAAANQHPIAVGANF